MEFHTIISTCRNHGCKYFGRTTASIVSCDINRSFFIRSKIHDRACIHHNPCGISPGIQSDFRRVLIIRVYHYGSSGLAVSVCWRDSDSSSTGVESHANKTKCSTNTMTRNPKRLELPRGLKSLWEKLASLIEKVPYLKGARRVQHLNNAFYLYEMIYITYRKK